MTTLMHDTIKRLASMHQNFRLTIVGGKETALLNAKLFCLFKLWDGNMEKWMKKTLLITETRQPYLNIKHDVGTDAWIHVSINRSSKADLTGLKKRRNRLKSIDLLWGQCWCCYCISHNYRLHFMNNEFCSGIQLY